VGQSWREDASNEDTTRARALVRTELMPVAEKLNPAVRTSIVRTMELLADDDALLSRMAGAFARDFARVEPGERVEIDREWMSTLERTMARRTIRTALIEAFPAAARIEAAHVEALVDGMTAQGFARDLPFGLRAVSEYGTMIILRSDAQVLRVAPSLLSLPGNADLGPAGTIRAEQADSHDTLGDSRSIVIDVGAVHGALTIDGPRDGDRMKPLGMTGSRKVSDVLTDSKVPRRLRSATPVVRDGEHIVWLAGVQMSEDYKVTGSTQRAFRLTWTASDADNAR